MGPTSFIMILIGCTNGGSQCAPISTLPVAYRNQASCLDARVEMMAVTGTLGFDRVIAECRPNVSAPRQVSAKAPQTA